MRGKSRKALAFFLAFAMCVSLINTNAFAAEITENMQENPLAQDETVQEEKVEEETLGEAAIVEDEIEETMAQEETEEEVITQEAQEETAKEVITQETQEETAEEAAMTEDEARLASFLEIEREQEAPMGEVSDEVKNQIDDDEDEIAAASNMKLPDIFSLTSYKKFGIAPGITQENITFIRNSDKAQTKGYMATVDLSNSTVGILAGYKDYDDSGNLGLQTVRDQAAACERKTGKKIVAAINADYFNMSTGEPFGALIMNNKLVFAPVKENYAEEAYFAILKDGTAAIRDRGEDISDVKEAVGSPIRLIRNGVVSDWLKGDTYISPRVAAGIKEDGSVVFLETDGRQAPRSVGISVYDIALMMKELGCYDACYLDGGGSATFASRTEGEDVLTVKNSPSDGVERSVSTTLFVYSDAKADGEFIHASLSPQGEVYTPNAEIPFTAKGADSAGAAAALPEDAIFQLKDEKYGVIDEKSGVFRSNGTLGEVEVQLVSSGTIVGSTTIDIKEPDTIKFANEQVTMGFEQESDLGLYVSCENSEINYSGNDFEWTISNVRDANQQPSDKQLGSFDGNIFKSSDGATLYGTITCTYHKQDGSEISSNVEVIVGLQPTILMDFEDKVDENGNTIDARKYWAFNRAVFDAGGGSILGIWDLDGNRISAATANLLHGHYCNGSNPDNSRGGEESAEVVDIASGYPVLKGNYSLKLNYDFSKANGTEGACVGFSQASQTIPGNPTAIGMYVYVPEGTSNLWLRIRVRDGAGTVQTLNFTESTGINWTGWKYVEAKLETGGKPLQGPFSLIGGETIRVMYLMNGAGNQLTDGTPIDRSQCKGSLFIDNVQFVYGANTDDTDNPIISSIQSSNQDLKDDITIKSNIVSFEALVSDVENKYTSGVNYDTVNIILDGKNITNREKEKGNLVSDPSKGTVFLYNQYLANGEHIIKMTIRDNFGNETSKTETFTVDGTEQVTPDVKVESAQKTAPLGGYVDLNVLTDQLENVDSVKATVRLATGFSEYKVSYAQGYEEAAAPEYMASENSVKISARKKADVTVAGAGSIATVSVKIPENVSSTAHFSYTVTSGDALVKAKDGSDTEVGFATKTKTLDIKAKYNVTMESFLAGKEAVIKVVDEEGKPAANVSVYKEDGTEIGVTKEDGIIKTSIFSEVESIAIYAKDAQGARSFMLVTQSYTAGAKEDGTPTFVSLNASNDSETEKNITWLSNPNAADKKAIAQIALKSDYDKDKEKSFKNYEGEADLLWFNGSSILTENRLTYSNKVVAGGLTPDKEYVYRVGDGTRWSEIMSFETACGGMDTNFFVIGDTQANDKTIISNIVDTLSKDKYNFGVQTGDFVEKADLYMDWESILEAFDNPTFKGIDTIHVTGNHELYGDTEGRVTQNLFNLKSEQVYSVTYNNVYIGVIGYNSGEENAKEVADWIAKDAAASDARWKILVSHQPPYGTNATTDDSACWTKYLPEAAQKGGIDFMFSGHDHAFARTYPLIDGKKVVEEDSTTYAGDGIVYFICGSTGEKSYSVTKKDEIHAEAGNDFYQGLYFTVNATNSEFKISVHDESGAVVREYTKTKEACQNDLHTYLYKNETHLVCEKCGHTRRSSGYTGLVHVKENGRLMYFEDGKLAKNKWLAIVDDYYYFDADGIAVTGKTKINGIEYTFDENGKFLKGSFVQEEVTNGTTTKTITRYYTGGGVFAVHWLEIDGDMYYFKKTSNNEAKYDLGMMYTGDGVKETLVRTVADNQNRYYVFGPDGKLVRGAFDPVDIDGETKIRYYWGEEYVEGVKEIEGHTYVFDENGFMEMKDIAQCDFSKVRNYTYTRKTQKPEVTIKDGDQVLKAKTHYTVTYENSKNAGTATITITGKIERGYTGTKVLKFNVLQKNVNGSGIKISDFDTKVYTGEAITPSVSVRHDGKTLTLGTDYKVTYKNNTSMGRASVVVEGMGNYCSKKTKTFAIVPKKVVNVKATSKKYDSITLSWDKLDKVTGYRIYRSTNQKNFTNIATVKGSDVLNYTDKDILTGKNYYYKVRAYYDDKKIDKRYYGAMSNIVKTKAVLAKAVIRYITSPSARKAVITWREVEGADGYVLYRASSENGTYEKVKTITSKTTLTHTKGDHTRNRTYYYKIRAYKTVNDKKTYGAYSDIKSIRVR